MSSPGVLWGSLVGPDLTLRTIITNGGASTFNMTAQNAGWAARFTAISTKDIKSVNIHWSAVTGAGTVRCQIETVDSAGEPTGTLYDANATVDFTPAAGVQTVTFATTPTTGLTVGTAYAITLVTTVAAGTAHTLSSTNTTPSAYVGIVLTAADASTRSNFAEVANSRPICSLIMDDNSEEILTFSPFCGAASTSGFYSSTIAGAKIVLASTVKVAGIAGVITKIGTPVGDIAVTIRDGSNNTITGCTGTILTSIATVGMTGRPFQITFASPVEVPAGTYYVCFTSTGSANSSNCWSLRTHPLISSGAAANNFWLMTNSSDTVSGATVSTTTQAPVWLVLDADVAPPTDSEIATAVWAYESRTLTG